MNSLKKSSSDSELTLLNSRYKGFTCRRQRSNSAKAYFFEDFSDRASLENYKNNPAAKLLKDEISINDIKSPLPSILRGQKAYDSSASKEMTDDGSDQPPGNNNMQAKSPECSQDVNTYISARCDTKVTPSKSALNCMLNFQENFNDDQNFSHKATENYSHQEDTTSFLECAGVEFTKPTPKDQICISENSNSNAKLNVSVMKDKDQVEVTGNSNEDKLDKEKESVLQIDGGSSSIGNSNAEISSPYQILEEISNQLNSSENIFGQPRCLTLKQCDANARRSKEREKNTNASEYIFSEDCENETDKKRSSLQGGSLYRDHERNRETLSLDREEGELTPDLYSSAHSDIAEAMDSKKQKLKESTTEFLSKINQCFLQLEEEFTEMHVPKNSTRLKEHLQHTLKIVDGMKRKLSFLVESSSSGEVKNSKKSRYSNTSTQSVAGDRRDLTSSQKIDPSENRNKYQRSNHRDEIQRKPYRSSTSGRSFQSRHEMHKKTSQPSPKFEGKNSKDKLALVPETSKSKESPKIADNPRRKGEEDFKNDSYPDGKREKQRIESLFKRQMNLITQHVIQKREGVKKQQSKSGGFGASSKSELIECNTSTKWDTSDSSQKVLALEQLNTLDDMENFLQLLKEKQPFKFGEKKNILKFTTKKPTRRATELPKFLTEAKADINNRTGCTHLKEVLSQNEKCSKKIEEGEKFLEQTAERKKVLREEKSNGEKKVGHNQSHPLNTEEIPKKDLSKLRKSKEQNRTKSKEKISKVSLEYVGHGIEFLQTEENISAKGVIDSLPVKRNSREMESIEVSSLPKDSGLKTDSHKMTLKNSKKRRRRGYASPELSPSNGNAHCELKDEMSSKKCKTSEAGHELSFTKPEKEITSKRKSRAEYRLNSEEEIDYFSEERLSEELKPRELFIVANENTKALLDKYFCFKVIGNEIYLQTTTGEIQESKCKKKEQKNSDFKSKEWEVGEEEIPKRKKKRKKTDKSETHFDSNNAETTLKEMEDFLQKLRAKKKISDGEPPHELPAPNLQSQEMKFMARIHAKRKAKLMACMSETPVITEKETKFLKDLERRAIEPRDSPSTERKKQKLMQKIRAETDAIVLAQKERFQKPTSSEEDPLHDVKKILSLIREAESGDAENEKQFYVSFPLKRSDVKKLANITEGRTSALSEESQRFLNNVRAKIRAKKTVLSSHGQIRDSR